MIHYHIYTVFPSAILIILSNIVYQITQELMNCLQSHDLVGYIGQMLIELN